MFDDIGKSVWLCLAALWVVSSVSCQFWQVGSDSSDGSVTQRIEVRYEADLLPERNDPPFAAESECGVQSINNGILNIEDNVSERRPGGSRCKFYFRNDPMTSLDDAVMEFSTRVRWVGAPGQSRSVQAGFFDGTKIILLGLSTTSVQFMARQGIEIPESRVHLDTTEFHTYKIVKHGDVSVDMFVDGELKIRISYESLSDYSASDAPRQGFGAGSSWGTSNSDWDYVNYTITRRAQRRSDRKSIAAPSFSVTSLDGEALESRSLRGKVVVLNFWFIGCAPCRAEIPGLNKLVDEFDQRDVVFIAFATDNEAPLRSFLEESPFKYKIVPAAHETIGKFNVSAYPTHVIIDQNGNVDTVRIGGGENRHEDLQPLIAALIKKSP